MGGGGSYLECSLKLYPIGGKLLIVQRACVDLKIKYKQVLLIRPPWKKIFGHNFELVLLRDITIQWNKTYGTNIRAGPWSNKPVVK